MNGTFSSPLSDYDRKKQELATATANTEIENAGAMHPLGPSAQSVNEQFAQQTPKTFAEFTGRGGLQNSVMQVVNNVKSKMDQKRKLNMYMELLDSGEKGADALYQDATQAIGPEAEMYIPNRGMREWGADKEKVSFYDEKGVFLPHQYAQAVRLGYLKWQKDQKEKQERMKAGSIIGDATSPQQASAGVLQTGQATEPYSKDIGNVMTPDQIAKEKADAEDAAAGARKSGLEADWYPRLTQATINEKNASAAKNRSGSGGSMSNERLASLNKNKADLLKQMADVDKTMLDPMNSGNAQAVINADKQKKAIQKAIDIVDQQISDAERTKGIGGGTSVNQEPSISDEAQTAAQEILMGMSGSPPEGTVQSKSNIGLPALSEEKGILPWEMNWAKNIPLVGEDISKIGKHTGEPDTDEYNKALSSRVIEFAAQKGLQKQYTSEDIALLLKRFPLETVIEGILNQIKTERAGAQQPVSGTVQ